MRAITESRKTKRERWRETVAVSAEGRGGGKDTNKTTKNHSRPLSVYFHYADVAALCFLKTVTIVQRPALQHQNAFIS